MRKRSIAAWLLSFVLVGSNCIGAESAEAVANVVLAEDTAGSKETEVAEVLETLDENPQLEEESEALENQGENSLEIPEDIVENEEEPTEDENTTNEISDYNNNKIILTLNSKKVLLNGLEYELLAAPKIVNDTTLLPLRFVGEKVIEGTVNWEKETNKITITKGDINVVVTIGSNTAFVNGAEYTLLTNPLVENDTTLVPVRFISEAFNLKVDYEAINKTITIHKDRVEEVIPNRAPIASFYFPQDYIAGQEVSAINTSIDPDGDLITDQLWSVLVDGKQVTNKQLSNMFKTPRAGMYTIGLQVRDAKGLWSDWTYETIVIKENQAPVITEFTAIKSSYAQGEVIDFRYAYDNESWEAVAEGKWTYRKSTEAENRTTLGKPDRIFTPGEYVITLYLDDAYGNRSEAKTTTITITDEVFISELSYRFTQGQIGDWIDNFAQTNYLNYTPVTLTNMFYDYGTLIMSDSPENVVGQGILYKDVIDGNGRLLIHHINQIANPTETQRLVFTVENPTSEPIIVTLKNKAIKGPATDVLRVGQMCLEEYLSGKIPDEVIVLQPGERQYIYDKNWGYNTCISSHIDVETTGQALFTIANVNKSHTLEDLDQMYYFPADGVHYSGTYDKTAINYEINLSGKEAERLVIGVKGADEWIVGYDQRTNTPVENTGNFGVSYRITVTAEEDMGVILNNRGGTFQGAIKWNNTVYNMPGKGSFIGTTTKAVVMGTIKKGETVTIEYLLPNGSAAPTLIGFIPKSQW